MTSSPTRALPAVPQATLACLDPVKEKIDAFQVQEAGKIHPSKDSPTERSLLRDFEQHAKDIPRKALSIVPNCEEGQSSGSVTGISPTAVTDLNVRAPPSSPKSSNTSHEALTPTSEKKDESDEITPLVEAVKNSLVLEKTEDSILMPDFEVHQFLMMRLSQQQINRVSFYGIIHDINKEATDMASNDTLRTDDETSCSAMIDEEQWLLSIIASRSPEETAVHRACPSTFSEAIGEVECKTNVEGETANPLSNLNASKTQLWKPSRSWWEARSGKNPWIEPRSHNKRWRYLWPLIHYHKFLARCIKKLKRNGVEVRSSPSDVCIFLREEVCAISDHLGEVSKFTAEDWLAGLAYFNGWTNSSPKYEECLRKSVSTQKLKSFEETSDVNSTLLKSQIDEQFLKAMEAAKLQMRAGNTYHNQARSKPHLGRIDEASSSNHGRNGTLTGTPNYRHQAHHGLQLGSMGNFPLQNHSFNHNVGHLQRQMNNEFRDPNMFPQYFGGLPPYNHSHQVVHNHFHAHGTFHNPAGLGGSFPPSNPAFPPSNHVGDGSHFFPSIPYQGSQGFHHGLNDMSQQNQGHFHVPESPGGPTQQYIHDRSNMPWMNQHENKPYYAYGSSAPVPSYPPIHSPAGVPHDDMYYHQQGHMPLPQSSPAHSTSGATFNSSMQVPPSPYWGHLGHVTLQMTGLASPQQHSPVAKLNLSTKKFPRNVDNEEGTEKTADTEKQHNFRPLFVNPSSQMYHKNNSVPPSPATQFLMAQTPQYYSRPFNSAPYTNAAQPTKFNFDSQTTETGDSDSKSVSEKLDADTTSSKDGSNDTDESSEIP